jgi:NDP-sugar pyrophosphorylase family protein
VLIAGVVVINEYGQVQRFVEKPKVRTAHWRSAAAASMGPGVVCRSPATVAQQRRNEQGHCDPAMAAARSAPSASGHSTEWHQADTPTDRRMLRRQQRASSQRYCCIRAQQWTGARDSLHSRKFQLAASQPLHCCLTSCALLLLLLQEFVGDKINAGIYVVNPSILDRIELRPTSIEREVFPHIAADNKLFAFTLPGYWMDVGQPKDYLKGGLGFALSRGSSNNSEGVSFHT